MAAIALYALAPDAKDPFTKWLKDHPREVIVPYVLQTSQWQLWNIFAPNPTRRVTEFSVEVLENETWKEKKRISHESFHWWNRAYNLKIIRRLDEKNSKYGILKERYLLRFCDNLRLMPTTPIRLIRHWHVIPKEGIQMSVSWWRNWKPEWDSRIEVDSSCPEVSGSGSKFGFEIEKEDKPETRNPKPIFPTISAIHPSYA